MYSIDLNLIKEAVLSIIIILGLVIGFSVYLSDKKSRTNKLFFIATILILGWVGFGFLSYLPILSKYSLQLMRINYFFVSLSLASMYFLVVNFPSPENKIRIADALFVSTGIFFALFSAFTSSIISGVDIVNSEKIWVMGNLSIVFDVYTILTAILVVFILIYKYYKVSPSQKTSIRLFSCGAILVGVFNVIFNTLSNNDNYNWIGDYSIIFLLGFTAYAIIKHHLFNIKVIATETTVVALSIGLLIEVFLSNNLTEGLLKGVVWILATYGGYILIKSVKVEIKQKEDLQKLTKKLDEANSHLEELDEAKDNFLSMAAHELNTPIAAIEGYLSMIIDEKMAGDINEKAMGYLKNIYGSSKRLAGLVRDLLNVSRIESNRVHLIYTETKIEDVIEQSISEVKIKADEVGHKLIFEKPKTALPKTWFDVDRITEVVINIIGNAIKYTEPPGKIVVSAHTDGDKIVIAVEDNGRGIPKDKYDHVFEKFVQVNVLTDQVKGTGLGMFISKNLIEMHKGKVWFKSSVDEKDHGTTFYFSLPILKDKPFDPHEGEGALFQTGKKSSKQNTDNSKTEETAAMPADKADKQTDTDNKQNTDNRETEKPKTEVIQVTKDEKKVESEAKAGADIKREDKAATIIPTKDSFPTTTASAPKTPADTKAK